MSMENFALIWLDFDGKRSFNDYLPSIRQFEPLIHTITFVQNQDEYINAIENATCAKLFVIISGETTVLVTTYLDQDEKIDSIYFHTQILTMEEKFTRSFRKVKGFFSRVEPIFDALRRDIRRLNIDLVPIEVLDSFDFSSSSINSLILRRVLLNERFSNIDQQKSIEFFREKYKNNSCQLKIVEELAQNGYREYSPIQWYTRESFLFQMIQRGLKTADVEILFHLAPFIRDLHRQIDEIHRQKTKTREQFTVFYCQSFSADELDVLLNSSDRFLTFNTFVFATIDLEPAVFHAVDTSSSPVSNRSAVVFQIHIDRSSQTFPYANVDGFDYFDDSDRHVLFSFTSVFRLISIEKRGNRSYQVDLILINENDEQFSLFNKFIDVNCNLSNDFLRLAEWIYRRNEIDRVEKLLHSILEENLVIKPREIAWIHMKLGDIAVEKGDWTKALSHFNTRLTMEISLFAVEKQKLAFIYGKIAWVETKRNQFDEALTNFKRAAEKSTKENPSIAAIYHEHIGEIYSKKNEKISARHHLNASLDLFSNSSFVDQQSVKRIEGKLRDLK